MYLHMYVMGVCMYVYIYLSIYIYMECILQYGTTLRPTMTRGLGKSCPHFQPAIPSGDHDALETAEATLNTQVPDGIVYAYQDDVTLVAHPDALATCA